MKRSTCLAMAAGVLFGLAGFLTVSANPYMIKPITSKTENLSNNKLYENVDRGVEVQKNKYNKAQAKKQLDNCKDGTACVHVQKNE